jgi:hypothetical protein
MKLQLVPARQGAQWVRAGFAVFFKRPLAFAALFMLFILFGIGSMLLPLVGAWLLLSALPLVSLAFMLATHHTLRGQAMGPAVFIEPLRVSRKRSIALVQMGIAYAMASVAIIWLSEAADGGKFEALQEAMAGGKGDAAAVAALLGDPQLLFGLVLRFGLASLLSLPFWHAPALVHWGDLDMRKSLFFSTVACWRNLGAFAVYGLAWAGVILAFGVAANVLAALLVQPQLIALAAIPAGLLFSTVFYASLYFTVDDCFAVESQAAAAPAEDS